MSDWFQIGFYVLGPVALTGVIWVFMQINNLRKDYALTKESVANLQSIATAQADIPGRVIKLETTIPFIVEAQKRIESLVTEVQRSTQRIEVLVAKNSPTT